MLKLKAYTVVPYRCSLDGEEFHRPYYRAGANAMIRFIQSYTSLTESVVTEHSLSFY